MTVQSIAVFPSPQTCFAALRRFWMSYALLTLTVLLWLVLSATASRAELLTLSRGDTVVTLDEAAYNSLPEFSIDTDCEYVNQRSTFTGVLLRDLLALVEAKPGEKIIASALNDYKVSIPVNDAYEYDVVVARYINGERMRIRDFGPLWIMYPHDDLTRAYRSEINSKLIWQLASMDIVE